MSTEHTLDKLWATIESRRNDPTAGARLPPHYAFNTAVLLQNPSKLRKKLNEETYELNEAHQALLAGVEVDIGSKFGAHEHVAREAADVLWHVYVLLASANVTPEEVYAVMERRHVREMDYERRVAEDAAAGERVLAEGGEPAALDETLPVAAGH
jgi:phosphoribosyl-ATP pyrophosphohydrolase